MAGAHDDLNYLSEDDVQAQAAGTVNNSPSAAMPVPEIPDGLYDDDDLEGNHAADDSNASSTWLESIQRRLDTLFAPSTHPADALQRPHTPDRNR